MSERDEEHLQKLQDSLNQARILQQQRDAQIEEVRVELQRIALETAQKYQREVEALEPEGQRVMNEVIVPWFNNLVSSGTYDNLMEWERANEGHISLSGTILYYWPRSALGGTAQGADAYQSTAKFIIDHSYHSLEEAIRLHANSDEVWCAYFYLKNSPWNSKSRGVILDHDPTVGMGFASAMSRQFRRISTDPSSISRIYSAISPEVWIDFGKQIQNGDVWENIENSMKPRTRTHQVSSGTDLKERLKTVSGQYLQSKTWH